MARRLDGEIKNVSQRLRLKRSEVEETKATSKEQSLERGVCYKTFHSPFAYLAI